MPQKSTTRTIRFYRFLKPFVLLCVPLVLLCVPLSGRVAIVYDVRAFGAKGDGKNLDSPSINKAIEAAAAAGGGTVSFPAGTYLSVSIRLRSNITLQLEHGATILAADAVPGKITSICPSQMSGTCTRTLDTVTGRTV